jgi:hypothetical protein
VWRHTKDLSTRRAIQVISRVKITVEIYRAGQHDENIAIISGDSNDNDSVRIELNASLAGHPVSEFSQITEIAEKIVEIIDSI